GSEGTPPSRDPGVSVAVQANFDPPVPASAPPSVRRPLGNLAPEKVSKDEDDAEAETAAGSFSE
ncbi:unnamed protein product, partial [Symbiodinium pilosum]